MRSVLKTRSAERNSMEGFAALSLLEMDTKRHHTNVQTGLKLKYDKNNIWLKTLRPRDCTCWEKVDDDTPCEKKSCPKIKGLLGKCSVEMPAKGFVKTDYLCEKKYDDFLFILIKHLFIFLCIRSKMTDDSDDDDASDCSCWVKDCKPKSKSKSCKGGYCWPSGISPGKSWEMAGYCNK